MEEKKSLHCECIMLSFSFFVFIFIFEFYASVWILFSFVFSVLCSCFCKYIFSFLVRLFLELFFFCALLSLFPLSHDSRFNSSLSKTLFLNDILKSTNEKQKNPPRRHEHWTPTEFVFVFFLHLVSVFVRVVALLVGFESFPMSNSKYRVQKAFIVRVTKKRQDWKIYTHTIVSTVCFCQSQYIGTMRCDTHKNRLCSVSFFIATFFHWNSFLSGIDVHTNKTHRNTRGKKLCPMCFFFFIWSTMIWKMRIRVHAFNGRAILMCARGALFDLCMLHTNTRRCKRLALLELDGRTVSETIEKSIISNTFMWNII